VNLSLIASPILRRAAAVVVAAASISVASIAPVAAQDPPNSDFDVEFLDLLVADANGAALDSGSSVTPFTVVLDGEDQCPGDSTHDGYRVDSYVVPLDTDPAQLDFNGFGPNPPEFQEYASFQMPLIPINGNGLAAELTGDAFEAGGPGPIRGLPGFDFSSYVPSSSTPGWAGGVPPGAYRVGIACTYGGRMTNAWETTMEVTADPADQPVGMHWTITGPQPRNLETAPGDSNTLLYVLLGIAVVAGGVAFFLFRSSKRPDDPSPVAKTEEPVP
jgi:LPXTG-motif cell wall-anchored protein